MLGFSPWTSLLAVLLAAAVLRLLPPLEWRRIGAALDGNSAPVILGALSCVISWWVWGSLSPGAVMHDESAYLLQAELFARLRWTGATPPVPEFFQQLYVLVGPLASKYPPGNSLVLALGALVGAPGLPVILMNGCAAALIFTLARRVAGAAVALLTWLLWQSSFPIVYFHANYMSEGVTSLAWLATWWSIIRWRDGRGGRWLAAAAGAIAWCVITRPLTGVALGIVALAIVVRRCRTERLWRDLAPALGVGALVLTLLPLWSWRTTGNVAVSPLADYTAKFVPFDKPGFGARANEAPNASLPRDQWITSAAFYQEHARHTLHTLPAIAWQRLTMLDRDAWYEWRGGLRVFAVLGLLALTIEGWIAIIAFATQFALYLSYAHPSGWTLYYIECAPVPAFLTALGIVWLFRRLGGRDEDRSSRRILAGTLLLAAPALAICVLVARQVKSQITSDHAYYNAFSELLTRIPDKPAVVFVRYGEQHPDGISLVRNVVDPDRAAIWTVYDRGRDNAKLLSAAPNRAPYLFDEGKWTLRRLDSLAAATRPNPAVVVPAGEVRELRGVQRPR